jgi:hypothetical protein
MFVRHLSSALVGTLALASAAFVQPAGAVADTSLLRIARTVVVDSLFVGGHRQDETLVASDSTTLALLNAAGLSLKLRDRDKPPICPGSTTDTGAQVALPVGYSVHLQFIETDDRNGWILRVHKGCQFIYQGRGNGFLEGASWEIRKVNEAWRIVRGLFRFVT